MTRTRTAVVGGKRHLRLGFVFYTEKSSTPSVLAVLVLCLRLLAFVTVSARPPRVCQIWLTRYGICVREPSTSETAADVQLSIARLHVSNLTKNKSSWRLKTHWDTCDCSATPSIEISSVFFPKYLRQTPLDRHRLPTFSQTFMIIRYLSPVEAKISIVTRRGCRAGKIFVGMRLFCPQQEEKTKKEVLG